MKIFTSIQILLALTLSCGVLYAQDLSIDSLQKVVKNQKDDTSKVNTLSNLSVAFLLRGNDYKTAMLYAEQALLLSKKINFKRGEGSAYNLIGMIYMVEKNFQESEKSCFESLKIMQEIGDKPGISACYDVLRNLYENQGNLPEAIKYSYLKLKIDEETGDKIGMAMVLARIGDFNSSLHNDPEALKNSLASFRLYKEIGNKEDIGLSAISLANIFFKQDNYIEALKNDSLALKIFDELGTSTNIKGGLATCYLNIGKIYAKLGETATIKADETTAKNNLQDALKNYHVALKLSAADNDSGTIASIYANLGKLYIKLNNPSLAKDYLENGLVLYNKIGSFTLEYLSDIYNDLSTLDSIEGNYKRAYANYKLHILYRDSLAGQEITRRLYQAQTQYDLDKKDAILKVEQQKKDAELRKTRNLQYSAIAIFLLLAIFLFLYSRQKQKAKTKIEKAFAELKAMQAQLIQSEKMASLGELTAGIAHEIQNPLNFVNNFSEINTELIEELEDEADKGNIDEVIAIAKDIKDNEQKIIHHGKRADSIVKGMLQHSRASTGKRELIDINVLIDECIRLSYHGMKAKDKEFNAKMLMDLDENVSKINVVPQDISRVLINLFNNAFYAVDEKKKAPALKGEIYEPTVSVTTKHTYSPSRPGGIEIHVRDNGNGIPQNIVDKIFQPFFTTKPTGQGTGLGLSLSYDIIKAHGGEIKVKSAEGEGSEFLICLLVNP